MPPLPDIMPKSQSKDKRFKEAYAKELAKALQANEQLEQNMLTTRPNTNAYTDKEIEDAYLALCYDDPQLNNDELCRELASVLLGAFPEYQLQSGKSESQKLSLSLGLSDRFVNGVLQTTNNSKEQTTTSKPDDSQADIFTPYNGEQFIESTSASIGYAELAVASFLLGPLYCCRALRKDKNNDAGGSTDAQIQRFLGSYNGRQSLDTVSAFGKGKDDAATESFLQTMAEITPPENTNLDQGDSSEEKKELSKQDIIPVQGNINIPIKEIFATEEDPDDFDYGDDRYVGSHPAQVHDVQGILDSFNAKKLSQSRFLTADERMHRLESLLSELSYRRITVGRKAWNNWKLSKHLSSLTLETLQCLGDAKLDSLGLKFNNPLMALRDRAMDGLYGHDALETYLELIRVLLKSDSAQVGEYAAKNTMKDKGLSPSRSIGLSSLASVCSSPDVMGNTKLKHAVKIRETIMECLDEFVDCIEFVRPKKSDNLQNDPSLPTWVRVSMALSQVMDFVTGVKSRSDCCGTDESFKDSLSTSDAQQILQSGLFREIILLFGYTEGSEVENCLKPRTATATVVVREQLSRLILVLSSKSQILGKYAARVPELTNILYSDSFRQASIVDAICWYSLLGTIVSTNKGPQLRMKGVVTISGSELKTKCRTDFLHFCETVIDAIKNDTASNSIVSDFLRLSSCFQQLPYLTDCWKETVSSGAGRQAIKTAISNIMKALPAFSVRNEVDGDKEEKKKVSRSGVDFGTIAAVRKSCKSLLLSLDIEEGSANLPSTRLSSKTD